MIKKRETCLYCGEKMESKTAKKKFCSALHKLYWHRENKIAQEKLAHLLEKPFNPKGVLVDLKDFNTPTGSENSLTTLAPKTNYTINTIPKSLEDIKNSCPKNLKGLVRTIWIQEQRDKCNL